MTDYFRPGAAQFLFGLIFMATWQAAAIILLSLVMSLLTQRSVTRNAIWISCIAALVLAPLLSLLLPHCFIAYRGTIEPLHFPGTMVPRSIAAHWGNATSFREMWPEKACGILVFVWATGVLFISARLAHGWMSMKQVLRAARPCHDDRVRRIVARVVDHPSSVEVLQLDDLVGAMCWQIHQPKIIVPTDRSSLDDSELEMIIRHEWSHLRRSDPAVLFAQRLVEALYWYHPLVWWATMQAGRYREYACDDFVLQTGINSRDYANCLARLATGNAAPAPILPAGLGAIWNQHLVLQRVRRILAQRRGRTVVRSPARRAALFLAACCTIFSVSVIRLDGTQSGLDGEIRWTAWPSWSAGALDCFGIQVRDYPLDAHRYDPSLAHDGSGAR